MLFRSVHRERRARHDVIDERTERQVGDVREHEIVHVPAARADAAIAEDAEADAHRLTRVHGAEAHRERLQRRVTRAGRDVRVATGERVARGEHAAVGRRGRRPEVRPRDAVVVRDLDDAAVVVRGAALLEVVRGLERERGGAARADLDRRRATSDSPHVMIHKAASSRAQRFLQRIILLQQAPTAATSTRVPETTWT